MTSAAEHRTTSVAGGSAVVAATYERVSTRTQGQTGFSLGAQAKDTAQYAAEMGWSLPDDLRFRDGEDRHASGADWDLPGLNAMLDAAKRHEFSVLIVPAVDRFARDMVKAKVLEQQLSKLSVRTVYLSAPVEDSPEGHLLVNIQHVFAEYERAKIAFRTSRGRREKVERGQILGNGPAPYGYQYVREGTIRPKVVGLKIDEKTSPIVERIFRDALRLSAASVVEALRSEGVTPPLGYGRRDPARRWAVDVVLRILTHPVYAGRMVYGSGDGRQRAAAAQVDAEAGIAVPPIVDRGLWEDVQKALTRRQTVRKSRKDGDDPWLLRGLLACAHCGGQLSVVTNWSRSTGRYRQYRCLRSQPRFAVQDGSPVCEMRDVRAEHLEDAVWGLVSDALMDPEKLRAGLDAARAEHEHAAEAHDEQLAKLDRDIARQKVIIDRLLDEILETPKGTETYRRLIERQVETEKLLRRLQGERSATESAPALGLSLVAAAELEKFAQDIRAGLGVATTSERRWVLDRLRLMGSVRLDPEGVRFGRLSHRFSLELNACIRLNAGHDDRWSLKLPALLTAPAGVLRLTIAGCQAD